MRRGAARLRGIRLAAAAFAVLSVAWLEGTTGGATRAKACMNPIYLSVSAETRAIARAGRLLRDGSPAPAYRLAFQTGAQLERRAQRVEDSETHAMPRQTDALVRTSGFITALATVRLDGGVDQGRIVRQLPEAQRREQLVSARDKLRGFVTSRARSLHGGVGDTGGTDVDPRTEASYLEAELAVNPDSAEALARFRALRERDLLPGPDTYAALSRAEARQGNWDAARSAHAVCAERTSSRLRRNVCGAAPEAPVEAAPDAPGPTPAP